VGLAYRYLRFTEQDIPYYPGFTYINIGTLTNLGFDLGYKYSPKKFWVEFLVGYGVKVGLDYDYPNNSSLIPATYTNDVFLNDANKFIRGELSVGYILN
jgi:outer membrane receptor protein involved in Fe transport